MSTKNTIHDSEEMEIFTDCIEPLSIDFDAITIILLKDKGIRVECNDEDALVFTITNENHKLYKVLFNLIHEL